MHPSTQPAIGPGHDILATHCVGIGKETIGDDFWMFDDVRCMADYARNEQLSIRQFRILPNLMFMLVADISSLD